MGVNFGHAPLHSQPTCHKSEQAMSPAEKEDFLQAVVCAVRDNTPILTSDESRWVRLAIKREAERAQFRRAIIDKSFTGLIWMGILGIGTVFFEYAVSHGMWKP